MPNVREIIDELKIKGYTEANAEARVCQDLVLKALLISSLSKR